MGIDRNRFIGSYHLNFICPICMDVLESPVIAPGCEHCFCEGCFDHLIHGKSSFKCPSCRQQVSESDVKPFGRQLMLVFSSLQMKCTESSCDADVTVGNFRLHDDQCPKKYKLCQTCGFKVENGSMKMEEHDCLSWLKEEKKRIEDSLAKSDASLKKSRSEVEKIKCIKRVRCGIEFTDGTLAYECKTCQRKKNMVLCQDCFDRGDHLGHNFNERIVDSGAFCDCGDGQMLKRNTYCSNHQPSDSNSN